MARSAGEPSKAWNLPRNRGAQYGKGHEIIENRLEMTLNTFKTYPVIVR